MTSIEHFEAVCKKEKGVIVNHIAFNLCSKTLNRSFYEVLKQFYFYRIEVLYDITLISSTIFKKSDV